MKQIFFVYLLTFANGKVYVGMSKTDSRGRTDNRYRQHEWTAKSGKLSPIYNAWRKHGAPVQSITSTHPTREACALAEIDAIQAYDSMNPARGYNLQPGGQGLHAPAGSAVYELMRAKVWHNPERRRKASEALKGKPLPQTVQAAQRAWAASAEGKAKLAESAQRPEVRAKLSVAMKRRLENDSYKEYLSQVQIGKPRNHTPEGKARIIAGRRAWLDSDAGRATVRAGYEAMRAHPDNETKRKAAAAIHAKSDANKAHCQAMAAKVSKPVKDMTTGQVYESRMAAARAFDVTGPTIGYWLKKGKFEYA